MAVDRVNQLNRAFTVIFTEAMQSLKPLTDIEKLRKAKRADSGVLVKLKIKKSEQTKLKKTYAKKIKEWSDACAFDIALRKYVNELNNVIVLAGGRNSSTGFNQFTKESLEELDKIINSKASDKSFDEKQTKFEYYMNSCKPDIETDDEKLKAWNNAFTFPDTLNEFIKKLKKLVGAEKEIKPNDYIELVDTFIKELKVDKDEFLIKDTQNIAGEKYKIDLDTIESRANAEIILLVEKISNKNTDEDPIIPKDYKPRFKVYEDFFTKTMKDVKKDQLEIKADKKIIEKKYDKSSLNFDLDEELVTAGINATKKLFSKSMDWIAGVSIIAILGLAIMSVLCLGCTFETGSTEIYPLYKENESIVIPFIGTEIPILEGFNGNPYAKLLESNVVVILVSTIVAPLLSKLLKEKFDIDVTEKQVGMIVNDGIKSVSMYAKEADKLRDENGHIPRKYQKTLRDKAFNSIRENYDDKKYKDLTANVGGQLFDQVIEHAVKSGKIKRFPIEKKQVEELIKQSIDAVPQIVEWQTLDEEVKNTFIDGNIRKLLKNTGINGWPYKALENVFDVETNKRLVGASLIVKDNVLKEINSEDPYLKYTSTAINAILEREKPKIVSGVVE